MVAALLMIVGAAFAAKVNIVTQEKPLPAKKGRVAYFGTIQEAVNHTSRGDWVLIEPGIYKEEVRDYKHPGIWIRGMDRNKVILDGENKPKPGGSNGIEVYKTNDVYIENLTVRNFDRETSNGPNGNEIWWNGGEGSNKIGAHGWWGQYLTTYDTGLNGGYGIFTNNETEGKWENIYASGMNDSGMYLGACPECKATINKATMENNALGYSGSNSGGKLVIENSVIAHNADGLAPNSENPGDGPPPQNGACVHTPYTPAHPYLPKFTSTNIERCTIFRNNLIVENNNLNTPDNPSSAAAPFGVGVLLPGTYADLVENNIIAGNPANGVLGFEYPNPFPPTEQTLFFEFAGNRTSGNTLFHNGYLKESEPSLQYTGDITYEGGFFGKESTQDCVLGNSTEDANYPAGLETTWSCANNTTPNPQLPGQTGPEYLLTLQYISEHRTPEAQPAPPEQETMPNPCEDVPANPLCPRTTG